MNSQEITQACLNDEYTKQYFRGCFALNRLPKHLTPGGIWILNFDEDHLEGSHWCACSTISPLSTCYFDSFARKPPDAILESLFSHSKRVYYSDVPLQHVLTQTCGQYTIYVASLWSRGHSMLDILLQHFYDASETFKNDVLVDHVISSHFNAKKRSILIPEINK